MNEWLRLLLVLTMPVWRAVLTALFGSADW